MNLDDWLSLPTGYGGEKRLSPPKWFVYQEYMLGSGAIPNDIGTLQVMSRQNNLRFFYPRYYQSDRMDGVMFTPPPGEWFPH